jgi:hypothetical protein
MVVVVLLSSRAKLSIFAEWRIVSCKRVCLEMQNKEDLSFRFPVRGDVFPHHTLCFQPAVLFVCSVYSVFE